MAIKNLIFGGGGLRGVCYVGVFKYLEKYGLRTGIKNILGSSIGSFFSIIFALGYNTAEIEELAFNEQFNLQILSDIRPDSFLDLMDDYGLDSGSNVERFIKILCKVKLGNPDVTLIQLYQHSKIHLRILSFCVQEQKTVVFDHLNFPNIPVSLIVRMSTSFPIYYQPVKWMGQYYIDGDILQEYQFHLFKSSETLLFEIKGTDTEETSVLEDDGKKNFGKYILTLFKSLHSKNYHSNFDNFPEFKQRIVFIKISYDHFLNFDMNKSDMRQMIEAGYQSTKSAINKLTKNVKTDDKHGKGTDSNENGEEICDKKKTQEIKEKNEIEEKKEKKVCQKTSENGEVRVGDKDLD